MSHTRQQNFCRAVSEKFPSYFSKVKVLEVGSLNLNGTVRDFFTNCDYTGIDVNSGKDVDIVSKTQDLDFKDGFFDTIISAECFEHDPCYVESVRSIIRMLRLGGLFVLSCATTGRPEHGTPRSDGDDYGPESGYYKNLVKEDFECIEGWNRVFEGGNFLTVADDLFFWGIKLKEN